MDTEFLIFQSLGDAVVAAVVLFVAELIYLALGFGSGLIALGLMALFHPDMQDIVVILMLANLPIELAVVLRRGSAIDNAKISKLALGLVPGLPIGALLLVWGGSAGLFLPLILLLILAGVGFCVVPRKSTFNFPTWVTPVTGGLSGFLFGLMGAGGPPLVLLFQMQGLEKRTFRDHLITLFLLVSLLRLPVYAIAGLLSVERILSGLLLFPALLAGALIGHRIHLRLPQQTFRFLLGGLLTTLGLVLAIKGLS